MTPHCDTLRNPLTIARYLTRDVAQTTALGLLAAVPVVLVPNAIDRIAPLLASGMSAADQLSLLGAVVPLVLAYALPIAFWFGVAMAVGRWSADGELLALRSVGVGTHTLLVPVACLGLAVSALTAWLMIDVEPRAKRELLRLTVEATVRGGLLAEGRFEGFGDRVIFARRRADDRSLAGVMISDWSDGERTYQVFAERGRVSYDGESGLVSLVLADGEVRVEPPPKLPFDGYRLTFGELDYRFEAPALGAGRLRYRTDQLGLGELRDAAASLRGGEARDDLRYRDARIYETQLQRVFALPLAPFLFAVLGVPLGVRGFVRSRAWGMIVALVLFAGYYGLFFYTQDLSLLGRLPPPVAVWAPNAVLALVAAGLLWDSRRLH